MPHSPKNSRRILCIYPRHTNGYPNFSHAFGFFPEIKALMPPQGILIIAAYLPKEWEVRFIDEDVSPATDADYRWADVIVTSGTHQQRILMAAIAERAHQLGKLAVVGGPSASACPEFYPQFDLVHVGELGDATDQMIAAIDASIERRATCEIFRTTERLAIEEFPIPAYHLLRRNSYLMMNVQWSSGCPFTCEFCDIPELYGRVPRYKSPDRLLRELDNILAQSSLGTVFFVDDNLIGNKKAFKQLLPRLIDWQKQHGYPLRFVGECTLNISQDEEVLALMQTAGFIELFLGVETAEAEALVAVSKKQNLRMPMVDAVRKINDYGIAITAGIIIGLDTDTDQSIPHLLHFINETNIAMPVINLLYAPPHTPLQRRLAAEGRLIASEDIQVSNVRFAAPTEVVHARWQQAIDRCYEPAALFGRLGHVAREVHTRRLPLPHPRPSWQQVRLGLYALAAITYRLGVVAPYRRHFWDFAKALLQRGQVESLVNMAAVAYHMIRYRDEVLSGRVQPCIHTEATKPIAQPIVPLAALARRAQLAAEAEATGKSPPL